MVADTVHSSNAASAGSLNPGDLNSGSGNFSAPRANPSQVLPADILSVLNQRSNGAGVLRLTAHLALLGLSSYCWGQLAATGPMWLALASLVVYGASLAFMFCTVHECVHRTAFASKKGNDAIAWLAGLFSFYNSTFYRRYHKWHHRYTLIPGKDPELDDAQPETLGQYLWHLSGIPWWAGKIVGHFKVATGQLEDCYFLPESARAEVIRSTQLHLGVYGLVVLFSSLVGQPGFIFEYWLLPLAVGQPLLRFVLLAEHTGCSSERGFLSNTRTTLTLWPLRFLMWNMPYHAEHHLYPSIPFHALPAAHQQLREKFSHIDPGYWQVNRAIVAGLK